jgi:3-methyladenine DNA glycosylase/8-oxoguanine DNA glycosylase
MSLVPDASAASARERTFRPDRPVDLALTLGAMPRGTWDPTYFRDNGVFWLTRRTSSGPATLALRRAGDEVLANSWGDGAESALDALPALLGSRDSDEGFDASRHPLIAELHRRMPGLRLARTDQVFDTLAAAILEQKVTAVAAFRAWRQLVTKFGVPAPGPTPRPMFVAPAPSQWARIPSWQWHAAGVEPPQSRTLVTAAARGDRIEATVLAEGADPEAVLTSIPGIGPWTSAETRARALGDPDAVSVGDFHLAHEVGFALTGSRTDDDGMLELLAPWSGQRQRVLRLIAASGIREPRRGPRLAPMDHRGR